LKKGSRNINADLFGGLSPDQGARREVRSGIFSGKEARKWYKGKKKGLMLAQISVGYILEDTTSI